MNQQLNIGDLLIRPKCPGFINHVGVCVGPNAVLQNTPSRGEHIATVQEFAAGAPIQVKPTGVSPVLVLSRLREMLHRRRPYHVLERNCEHTATEVTFGKAISPQMVFWTCLAIAVAAGWLLFSGKRS